jgi:hypothetical protein
MADMGLLIVQSAAVFRRLTLGRRPYDRSIAPLCAGYDFASPAGEYRQLRDIPKVYHFNSFFD